METQRVILFKPDRWSWAQVFFVRFDRKSKPKFVKNVIYTIQPKLCNGTLQGHLFDVQLALTFSLSTFRLQRNGIGTS